jgi:hypothetical protein
MFAESVRLASFQQSLSDRDPWAGGQIYCRAILQNPSTLLKQRVDLLAREIFRRLHEARKLAEIQPSERGNPDIDPKSEATAAFRRAIRPCVCVAQLVVFVAARFAIFRFLFGYRFLVTPVFANSGGQPQPADGLIVKYAYVGRLFSLAERPLPLVTAII